MNKIWLSVVIVSIGVLLAKDPNLVLAALSTGSSKAVALTIELCAVYALWSGILKILEQTGVSKIISKILSPIIDFLFGKNISARSKHYISMNITANILGMGGAATPMGIKAIESLDNKQKTATPQMIMLVVLCATSLQVVPTSVIGLLSKYGAKNPTSIILPSIISSTVSTLIGVVLVKLFSRKVKERKAKQIKQIRLATEGAKDK